MLAALCLAHGEAYEKIEIWSCKMGILRFLCKMFRDLCGSKGTVSKCIDSHKWESKAEIAGSLSRRTR
jgi:hypothetical protein